MEIHTFKIWSWCCVCCRCVQRQTFFRQVGNWARPCSKGGIVRAKISHTQELRVLLAVG